MNITISATNALYVGLFIQHKSAPYNGGRTWLFIIRAHTLEPRPPCMRSPRSMHHGRHDSARRALDPAASCTNGSTFPASIISYLHA